MTAITKNDKKTTTILTAIVLLFVVTVSVIQTEAYALTCVPGSSHCYATEGKTPTTTTYGNKFTATVPNISGTTSTTFGTVETWIAFPNGDWIETGILQGYLDGTGVKNDEWMFTANWLMGVWQSSFPSDVNSGTSYTFEYEDDDGNYTWDARLNGDSKYQRIITWSRGIGASAGAEIAHDNVVIPKTKLSNVSHHDGTSYSYWSSANFFGTNPSPTTEIYIYNGSPTYRNFCVGTSSITSCT